MICRKTLCYSSTLSHMHLEVCVQAQMLAGLFWDTRIVLRNGTVYVHWSQCGQAWGRLREEVCSRVIPRWSLQELFIFESVKSIPATAHAKVILWHASYLNSVSRCTSGDDVTKIILAYQPFGRSSGGWGLLGHAQTYSISQSRARHRNDK